MTTGALATAAGVHQTSISSYENGKNAVPEERVEALARALRMDVIDVRRGLEMWVPDNLEPRVGTPEEAIRADLTLRPDQRELLLSMLATLRVQQAARVGTVAPVTGSLRKSSPVGTGPDFSQDFDDADLDNFSADHDPDRPPRDDWE